MIRPTSRAERRGRCDRRIAERWLENMIVDHRFTADEVRLATGYVD